jgi:Tfp pilus assembly major pilin PilA
MKKINFDLVDLMIIIGIISIFSVVGFRVYENHNPKTFENYSLTCNGVKINKAIKSKSLNREITKFTTTDGSQYTCSNYSLEKES